LKRAFEGRSRWLWTVTTRTLWAATNAGVIVVSLYSAWQLNLESEKPSMANDLRLRVLVTEIFSLANVTFLVIVVLRVRVLFWKHICEGEG
jgi:hypothetical protein